MTSVGEVLMKKSHWADNMTTAQMSLPFSGLGHDLEPVVARASTLVPVFFARVESVQRFEVKLVPHPAGYELHVLYGREIRGR